MTAFSPLNDRIAVFSQALSGHAEVTGFTIVSKTAVAGHGVTLTPNPAAGTVSIAANANILAGSGAPSAAVGADGDYYIDKTNKQFYGPKADGAWPTAGTGFGGAFSHGATLPNTGMQLGDFFWVESTSTLFIYSTDGTTSAWTAVVSSATLAEYLSNASGAANKVVPLSVLWGAGAFVAITATPDMSLFINGALVLTANTTIANPTNAKPGQSGVIVTTQDAAGGHTLSFGSNWKFPNGSVPSIDTTPGATNIIHYVVLSATKVLATVSAGVA